MKQITVIGDTGSGKTSYTYAMNHYLAFGHIKGFSLSCMNDSSIDPRPDYDKDEEMNERYEQLANAELGPDRFPLPSNKKTSYNFSLKYRLKKVTDFKWGDYPGNWIDSRDGGADMFLTDVRNSDTWSIYIDGAKLYHALIEIKDSKERNNYLYDKVFGKYLRFMHVNADYIPSFISIIVTKSDLLLRPLFKKWYAELAVYTPSERMTYAQQKAREEVINLFKDMIFDNIPEEKFQICISFVTLGDSIAENNYRGPLDPKNIAFPITVSLLSILAKEFKTLQDDIAAKQYRIEEIRQSIFTSKEKRIYLQNEIDNNLRPRMEHIRTAARAITQRINDNVILYNKGRNNTVGVATYFNTVFHI